ncbi:MAG: GerW family sporulation protein [Oscillospiraceae bacterium]|nr:GerW family sporulation protein [Oscillospiraceae bacterium]MBQ9929504.1 GerW family sporulation protein [Oscillospiraceae bacterium]
MSQTLPNMLENTIAKIREMVDVNSVIGEPITTADGVTIIPVSKVSVGFGGGGSDYVSRNVNKQENPFAGGAGGGVKVTPIAFLIVKEGSVRMLPVATPANTTVDRLVEQVPDVLDKIAAFVDSHTKKAE